MARKTAARAGSPGQKSRARAINQLQEFAAAERPCQVDFLSREEVAKIERARIEKIARRSRLYKRSHTIARTQALELIVRVRFAVQIHAQAAADRHGFAGLFHLFEVNVVTASPRKRHRVFAQVSAPAERIVCVEATGGDETRDVVFGNGRALDVGSQRAKSGPRDESQNPRRRKALLPQQDSGDQNRKRCEGNPLPERSVPSCRKHDAGRGRRHEPQHRQFHGRRRRLTTVSM